MKSGATPLPPAISPVSPATASSPSSISSSIPSPSWPMSPASAVSTKPPRKASDHLHEIDQFPDGGYRRIYKSKEDPIKRRSSTDTLNTYGKYHGYSPVRSRQTSERKDSGSSHHSQKRLSDLLTASSESIPRARIPTSRSDPHFRTSGENISYSPSLSSFGSGQLIEAAYHSPMGDARRQGGSGSQLELRIDNDLVPRRHDQPKTRHRPHSDGFYQNDHESYDDLDGGEKSHLHHVSSYTLPRSLQNKAAFDEQNKKKEKNKMGKMYGSVKSLFRGNKK